MTKYTTVGVSVYHPKGHLVATCDCSERADDVAVALSKLESKGAGPVRDDVVPGKMHCAKCKFSVIRNVLNLGNGSITAGSNETETCPNGCGPLGPVTWEQEARDGYVALEALFERAKKAEDLLAELPPKQSNPLHPETQKPKFPVALRKLWSGKEIQAWIDENWPLLNMPWNPMETAPKNGEMLRLLVEFSENPTEDSLGPCVTIGMNNLEHDSQDVWLLAGWDWQQDRFTQGEGTPVGWLPLLPNEHLGLKRNAELYLALRQMHWSDKGLCVTYAGSVKLGHQTYSLDLLDAEIEKVMAEKPNATNCKEPKRITRKEGLKMTTEKFQDSVQPWMMACFGPEVSVDIAERNHRFLEESLELVQACGCTKGEAHQLVEYVFNRPVGEKSQEAGAVMLTLAALCLAQGLDMHDAGETELVRVWGNIEQIRAKQASKPKNSPLPQEVQFQKSENQAWGAAETAFVEISPRADHKGHALKNSCAGLEGQRVTLFCGWVQEDGDPYRGESALIPADEASSELFAVAEISWISSGDVVKLEVK